MAQTGYMRMVDHMENGLVLGDEFREGNVVPASELESPQILHQPTPRRAPHRLPAGANPTILRHCQQPPPGVSVNVAQRRLIIRADAVAIAISVLLCLLFWPVPVLQAQSLDLKQSHIRFTGKQMGVPAEGTFKRFKAQIVFNPAKPETSQARIDIDLTSVYTDNADAMIELARRSWFDMAQFPTASFVSTAVKSLGKDRLEISGKLSIKGQTRPLKATVSVTRAGSSQGFEGGFTLLRSQFGIGTGLWADPSVVADEVQVRFKLLQK